MKLFNYNFLPCYSNKYIYNLIKCNSYNFCNVKTITKKNKQKKTFSDDIISAYNEKVSAKSNLNPISKIYDLNNKLGPPNIRQFIDTRRLTKKNYSLITESSDRYVIPENKNIKNIKKNLSKQEINIEKFVGSKNIKPNIPKMGPFVIDEIKDENKSYHWCSCGLSKKQPFCDRSHIGTKFRPISFKLGEKVDKIELCGCKLSSKAPFCDKLVCKHLSTNEEKEIKTKFAVLSNNNISKAKIIDNSKNKQLI